MLNGTNKERKVTLPSPVKKVNLIEFKTSSQFEKQISKETKLFTPNFRMNFDSPARRRTFDKKKNRMKV